MVRVSKDPSKNPRVRLFVALDLPAAARDGIEAWAQRELTDPALRAVPAANLHITLAFLGQRPPEDAERVERALAESAPPAPLIELLDPVARPGRGRAKLFALPVVSPGTEQIQAQLTEILVSDGLFEAETRPFWPHVTVARVRSAGRGSQRPMWVEAPPGPLPSELSEPFYGVRIALYRSELQPSGARYVPLAQVKLPGAGQQ